jgi:DNA polymerase
VDLPTAGLFRYAPAARVEIIAWAVDDQPVQHYEPVRQEPLGQPWPKDLHNALLDASVTIVAHYATFDLTILRQYPAFERIPDQRVHCTMAQALSHGLPGSLDQLGTVLGLSPDQAKIKDGRRLVAKFCKPAPANHRVDRYDWNNAPEDWARYVDYCRRDVEALREIHRRLPARNYPVGHERLVWLADQRINRTGLPIDVPAAQTVLDAIEIERRLLDLEVRRLTSDAVPSAKNNARLLTWLQHH